MQLYKIFHPFRILFPASSQSRYSIHRFCRLHTFERGRPYDHDRTSLGHFLVCLGRHLQRLLRFSMSGSPRLALYSYQLCMSASNTFMKASDDILSTAKHYVHKDFKKQLIHTITSTSLSTRWVWYSTRFMAAMNAASSPYIQ